MDARSDQAGRPRVRGGRGDSRPRSGRRPRLEALEARALLTAIPTVVGTELTITGGPGNDVIDVDHRGANLIVSDSGAVVGRFAAASLATIVVNSGDGNDTVRLTNRVFQSTTINAGNGNDLLVGGAGNDLLVGGQGADQLNGNTGINIYDGGNPGADGLVPLPGINFDVASRLFLSNTVTPTPAIKPNSVTPATPDGVSVQLSAAEVNQLLNRASAASPSNDGIIAVVDRGGRILGVRVESGVSTAITSDPAKLVFAIDGAVAKARTGAFFSNNPTPLTSRTVQSLSESTTLQREVESNPNDTDPNSILRGPGKVAGIGIKGHFPRRVMFTPQVDLFQIEYTNRDTTFAPGPDRIKGTPDDIERPNRFNIPTAAIPPAIRDVKDPAGNTIIDRFIQPPDSYGFESGLLPGAQPRGVGTLPGGLPILRVLVQQGRRLQTVSIGGLGVFYPGTTGFATEENSILNDLAFNPNFPDRSQEAEAVAIAALGGIVNTGGGESVLIRDLGGIPKIEDIALPLGRIDLVGLSLDIYGGHGLSGVANVQQQLERLGVTAFNSAGTVNGTNAPLNLSVPGLNTKDGVAVPEGFLVAPRDAADGTLTAEDVFRITGQSVIQANITRAAIRLPLDETARMIISISDKDGNVLGLYRMPDATFFSLDVATAKARNAAYYADPTKLQPIDQVPGVPAGTAFTARSFRFLALPHFPEGQDNFPPGPFSILNDGGHLPNSPLNAGPPVPATAFQSVAGFDAFNPQTQFRDTTDELNQNGVLFFPGSVPLYKDVNGDGVRDLVGGFGISGDGVDQDDVVTFAGKRGYENPSTVLRSDQVFVRGIRVPFQKFNRQPLNQFFEIPQLFPSIDRINPIP